MEISINPDSSLAKSLFDKPYRSETALYLPGDEETKTLQKILKGELSAEQAYEKVIHKFGDEKFRVLELLRSIAQDHEEAAFDLQQILRDEGVEPESDTGAWGAIVQAVVTSAGLFGGTGALLALRRGEAYGLRQYQDALDEGLVSNSSDYIRYRSIPTQQLHIDRLSAFLYLRSVDRD